MRPDKVAVRSNATCGQPAFDRDQERGFLEVRGQLPYPIGRGLLPRNYVGIDFDQDFADAPGIKAPVPDDTVMDILGRNPHRRVSCLQPERSKRLANSARPVSPSPAAAAMAKFSQVGSLTAAQRVTEKSVIAPSPGEDGRIGPPRAPAHYDVSSDESVWIVADNLILNAHILSEIATGLIKTFTLAMHNRSPIDEVYRQSVMTPHPLPGKQHHLHAQITAAAT